MVDTPQPMVILMGEMMIDAHPTMEVWPVTTGDFKVTTGVSTVFNTQGFDQQKVGVYRAKRVVGRNIEYL